MEKNDKVEINCRVAMMECSNDGILFVVAVCINVIRKFL